MIQRSKSTYESGVRFELSVQSTSNPLFLSSDRRYVSTSVAPADAAS